MKTFRRIAAVFCALAVSIPMTTNISMGSKFDNAVVQTNSFNKLNNNSKSLTALTDEGQPMSGKCGDNLTWVLDDEGTLTISGTGKMYNYSDGFELWNSWTNGYLKTAPEWFANRDKIIHIVIKNGVENIGNQAFKGLRKIETIVMPISIKSIGYAAFGFCEGYNSRAKIKYISYSGSKEQWSRVLINNEHGNFMGYDNEAIKETKIYFDGSVPNKEFEYCGEKISFKGHDYQLFKSRYIESADVISYCKEIGGYWAHINDAEENEFLKELICNNNMKCAYFGYTDEKTEGKWRWIDGKTSQYTNWAAGEPNNEYGQEHYALINQDGYWNDGKLDHNAANSGVVIICEFETSSGFEVDNTDTSSSTGKCGDNLTWTLNDKGALNISGTGEMYDYSISKPTPWNSDDVISATIENGVTSIGNYAFGNYCNNVFVPKSIKRIGESAFGLAKYWDNGYRYINIYYSGSEDEWNDISKPNKGYGTLLMTICHFNYDSSHNLEDDNISGTCGAHLSWNLDDNGTLTIRGTGEMYFFSGFETIAPWWYLDSYFNKSLTVNAVVVEDGVSGIGSLAFYDCKDIKSITLSDSVETIGSGAFWGCESITTIPIPKYITKIGDAFGRDGGEWGTFANCTSLTEFKVDGDNSSYKTVDGVLFTKDGTELIAYPAGKQSEKYSIPSGVETVGECAFEGCKNLKNVVIPNGVSKMGSYAFADCINLETAIIYEGVTSLNGFTFGKCSNLKKVYIPQSVTTIGDELAPAFVSCDSLSDVYYSGTEEDWLKIKITDEVINNATIHYNYAPDEVPGYSNTRSNIITVPFKERNVDFYWNDDLFSESAFEYNNNLAIASLVLAGAAESKSDEDVKRVLNDMEFKDIMSSENYDCFNVFQPAYIIGSKKITVNDKEKTLISITIRGTTKFADIITDVADGAIGFNSSVLFVQNGLLEYVNKYFNSVDGDDVILWISGHSLGGAVASSLGAYINDAASIGNDLDWNTYRPENIFTYSFAPPSYTTITSILKQHKNIFETINCLDFIPDLGGPKSRHTGIIREFDPFEVRDYANYYKEYTQKDFVPYFSRFPSTDYHACLAYMAFLKSGGEPTTVRPQKRFLLSVCCPVDVEVYDSDGKLLSRVTNNICDENITSDNVICIINGDKKYFIISTDDKYQVKFTGTDNGTMEYSVQKLRSADEIITEEDFITYETVELENGKMFYSEIPSNDDIAEVTLYVVDSETNEPVKSVELDGKETNLTGKGYIWLYIVGAVLIVGVTVILVLISYKKHKKHSFSSRR